MKQNSRQPYKDEPKLVALDAKTDAVEIIKDRLYWISGKEPPKNQPNAYFFNIDQDLQYEPFFADFGPHNLGNTYRFVTELEHLLADPEFSKNLIYHYTGVDSNKRTNACYLICAYQVIILNRGADSAWAPFAKVQPPFNDYRDASYGYCTYKCTILDCLRGLEYAIKLKWFNVRDFKLRDYEYYERVENGDLNVIIPEKFIAFSGPSPTQRDADGVIIFIHIQNYNTNFNFNTNQLTTYSTELSLLKTMYPFSRIWVLHLLLDLIKRLMKPLDLLTMVLNTQIYISLMDLALQMIFYINFWMYAKKRKVKSQFTARLDQVELVL
ncbi:tyrosine phosphatase, putative (macronuclear) [Tetrahymena thermophila SB210]|uniref:Tyrosine phosphatase, putative n=1 Tax=Tetrahymena thermophila (strain SB210) TaxID=312017 RepID=Q231C6_TETTS|nr:tyrosine phosphatase, putative [Tetrahymena thermophila SB210]EAR91113.2 tyrosine phosphatase, putative [Tetrahymena thermophila SB210]|eukprot:XP_001011358.2 tyrosine phosphatase, putative [Tetrahymena thermophila SB210]